MLTPYSKIYERFLNKIQDTPLVDVIETDVEFAERLLYRHLESAISHFTYTNKDLSLRDDEGIKHKLTDLEIEILSLFMVYTYLSQHVASTDKIVERLTPKDFTVFSSANLMGEIREMQNYSYEKAVQLMVENYYRNGSQWK